MPIDWVLSLLVVFAGAADHDTDGDGLSDFAEQHKYLTDPGNPDSDGDGSPDGDWDERREYAYTITSIVRVIPPVDIDAANDDFQDARLVEDAGDYVELEIVHYPLGTAHEVVEADPDWRKTARAYAEYTKSTTTSNFDSGMRRQLEKEIRSEHGIDPRKADDRTLAVAAAQQLMNRSEFEDGFTTFMADYHNGKAIIPDPLQPRAKQECDRVGRTLREQWDRELFARGMFRTKVHGSCTSSAIYLCGGLKSLGLPTRIVLLIPLIDMNDPQERQLVADGIRHHRVRAEIQRGLQSISGGWVSHTFNEVLIGGRWRRLNYTRLGQPILDTGLFGLTSHILTVRDWADARMGRTVGMRQELRDFDDELGYANPYSTIAIHDEFGEHANIDNPPVKEPEPARVLTIRNVFWAASDERPAFFEPSRIDLEEDRHHVFLDIDTNGVSLDSGSLNPFWEGVSREFTLRSDRGDKQAQAVRGFWSGRASVGTYLYFVLRIPESERARMKPGEVFRLIPTDPEGEPRFQVAESVRIEVPRD